MSQDAFGRIGFFEDFQGLEDPSTNTITENTSERLNDMLMIPVSGNETWSHLVDESGGVSAFKGDAAGAGDGIALCSSPMQPSGNGAISMGVRFKYSAVTDMLLFVGWVETVDTDSVTIPFSLSGTSLTSGSVGQCVGLYYDTAANTDDWRMMGSSDGTPFTTALGTLGTRATSTPVLDEYMVIRVEIDPDGLARCYYGDSSTDIHGTGLNLVDTLPAGNLDEDAVYHPLAVLLAVSTGQPTTDVDYFWAKGNRDWTV